MVISSVLVWFLFGIFCFVTELILPGFILFFLGIGAWCTASVLAVTDFTLTVQLMIFLVSSLFTLLLLRSWLRSIFLGNSSEEDDSVNVDSAPSTGVVIEAIIPPATGRVQYGGSYWQATADEPLSEGLTVLIVERKNLIIKVRSLDTAKEE